MVRKLEREETVNEQIDQMEIMRRMQRQMDEMQRKYDEGIKALTSNNMIIR